MKLKIPSVLAVAALVFAPFTFAADVGNEGLTGTSACSGETCPIASQATACAGETCPLVTQASASLCPVGCEKPCCADLPTGLTKVRYEVKDMTCAACETKVTQALTSIEGVGQTGACSKEKIVQVAFDAKKVKDKQLLAAIHKAGFKVSAEIAEVKVDGMKCEACSAKVSKALAGLKGVQSQEVCYEGGKALVKFDPNTISRQKVLAAINDTGFKTIQ